MRDDCNRWRIVASASPAASTPRPTSMSTLASTATSGLARVVGIIELQEFLAEFLPLGVAESIAARTILRCDNCARAGLFALGFSAFHGTSFACIAEKINAGWVVCCIGPVVSC